MSVVENIRPFILGHRGTAGNLFNNCPLPDPMFFDVLDNNNAPFGHLMNAANQIAFHDLGMPAWVQLDCCTLPSAYVGYAVRLKSLDLALRDDLLNRIAKLFGESASKRASEQEWAPISGFCGLPTWSGDSVIGVSLFCLLSGLGLGKRTKALGLLSYNVPKQIGVTQYTSPAVGVHAQMGPLRIISPQVDSHNRKETFAYELDVDQELLRKTLSIKLEHKDYATVESVRRELKAEARKTIPPGTFDFQLPAKPGVGATIAERIRELGPLEIVGQYTKTSPPTLYFRRTR